MRAEAEQVLVDRPAVVGGPVVHEPVLADLLPQLLPGERDTAVGQQLQLSTGALAGDEEPVPCDSAPGDGLQPAADRAKLLSAVSALAAELQPGVTETLRAGVPAAKQQVPLHPLLPVAVRLHPVRREVAVEQERQREGEHLGLAGSVVAAQEQPAVVEPELLLVVVEHVDQAGPQGLPPLRRWCWQHRPAVERNHS